MAYPQFYPQQMQFYQQPQAQPQPQMQNGGFISVSSEQVARNYPVAPGSVMTFKIENQPYVCEKAQGFSQLEGPIFNKYKLVKEEPTQVQEDTSDSKIDISSMKEDIDTLKHEIEALKHEVFKSTSQRKKKEVNDDDAE